MHLTSLLVFSFQLAAYARIAVAVTVPTPETINITTIATNAQKESTLECWQLDAPLVASSAAGTAGAVFAQLGDTGATSWGLIPPEFNGGMHNAPAVQWVVFLVGEAVISLPNCAQTATILGGRNGLILATDIKNASAEGHTTVYPSKEETVSMQIPTANNAVPPHRILHDGPCKKWEESTGS